MKLSYIYREYFFAYFIIKFVAFLQFFPDIEWVDDSAKKLITEMLYFLFMGCC